ncbi:MAG: hypothetical protein A2073_00660 [Deltaproteobacteria bacterium GWC2_42_11]|nr:MAG: hypothetical protein A2073_00660 [Deltaproteobacteria bacterium GWC2_42_11]HBO84024.1 hypothetical protein [Deltaproteobacteria bacterium]
MGTKQLYLKGFMERLGEYLKRQREMRGVSLEYISGVTKINKRLLSALENDDQANLPHPTFVKGFIRSYCKCAGIDGDDAVLRYEEYLQQKVEEDGKYASAAAISGLTSPISVFETKGKAVEEVSHEAVSLRAEAKPSVIIGRTSAAILSIAFVSAAVLYIGYTLLNKEVKSPPPVLIQDNSSTPPAETLKIAQETLSYRLSADGSGKEAVADNVTGNPLNLAVSVRKTTWMQVEIDNNGKPFEVLLREGDNITWNARERFSLVIGNAGGVNLVFNGKPLGKLGENGQVIRLVLPRDAGN